jgi:hypothetical protein
VSNNEGLINYGGKEASWPISADILASGSVLISSEGVSNYGVYAMEPCGSLPNVARGNDVRHIEQH